MTKGERREQKRQKQNKMKVVGRSVKLLDKIIKDKAKK